MMQLHDSKRPENLVGPLAASVTEHQRRRPRAPLSIIVPSRVVEQFVKNRLAESLGVAANLKFPFLRGYLAEILEAADPNLKILDARDNPNDLQLILFECLRSSAHRDDPGLKPAQNYIQSGSKTGNDIELRTLMLSPQLARLFRQDSISPQSMLHKRRAQPQIHLAPVAA